MSADAGQHPDSQHSEQQDPSKTSGAYWESLPPHVRLTLFNFLILDQVRVTKLRLERGSGNKGRTLPDSRLFISRLAAVKIVVIENVS